MSGAFCRAQLLLAQDTGRVDCRRSRERGSVSSHIASPPPELLQPSCTGGPGVLSEQQVLGGLSWQEVRDSPEG